MPKQTTFSHHFGKEEEEDYNRAKERVKPQRPLRAVVAELPDEVIEFIKATRGDRTK